VSDVAVLFVYYGFDETKRVYEESNQSTRVVRPDTVP